MMHRCSRGTALVETALGIGVSLLIVLGAAQMALIGYTQISADGAAFIAAHTAASNPAAGSVDTAQTVFPQFGNADFSKPSPSPQLDSASVSAAVSGFSLVPGVASSYRVTGKDVEYQAAGANASASSYAFDVNGTLLLNYCAPPGSSCSLPSNYPVYLASSIGTGNGNGANGQFAEWRCHQRAFARLAQSFSQYRPAAGGYSNIQKSNLDPNSASSDENKVYGWDGGSKCT